MEHTENDYNAKKPVALRYTIDLYTKVILTLIAFCLVLITSSLYLKPAILNASEPVQDVNLRYINGSSIYGSEIPVNLQKVNSHSVNDNIPVDIKQLKGWDLWDSQLPIDIKSVNGNVIYGAEVPIKVRQ